MHPCVEQSNGLVPLSLFPSWQGCITNTSGYDFRKGQVRKRSCVVAIIRKLIAGRMSQYRAEGRVILEADNFVSLLSHRSEAIGRRPMENEDTKLYLFCGLGYCED
jgi:hypothetical protein